MVNNNAVLDGKPNPQEPRNAIFGLIKVVFLSITLAFVGAVIGLYVGYHFIGGFIYDWYPAFFNERHKGSFPDHLFSKIRLAAIVDVTIFCGWLGLFVGGILPSGWLLRNFLRGNKCSDSNS